MAVYDRRKRDPNYRGTKPWVVDYFDCDGKRRSPGFASKKDADAYHRGATGDVALGKHNPRANSVTVAEAFDAYLADIERRHRLGHKMTGYTLRRYRSIITKHLRPALGRIKLSELTIHQCQALVDKMSETYIHQHRDAALIIYMMIKHAVSRGLVACSPLGDRGIELAPRKRNRAPKFEREDLRRLLAAVEKPLPGERPQSHEIRAAAIMLATFCALRRGEIAGLQIEDIDFANKLIGVMHSHSTVDKLKDPKTVSGVH